MAKEKKTNEVANVEEQVIEMTESVHIPDGVHTGLIKNVILSEREGFKYVDVFVTVDGFEIESIKTGFPAKASESSSFGKFLLSAGYDIVPGKKLVMSALKDNLLDRKIQYVTYTEDQYARISNKTIKFLK